MKHSTEFVFMRDKFEKKRKDFPFFVLLDHNLKKKKANNTPLFPSPPKTIGSFSNDDGNGNENVM